MSPTPVLNQELKEEQDERSALSNLLDLMIHTTAEENRGQGSQASPPTLFLFLLPFGRPRGRLAELPS